jgi:putative inorganic carbon (HCO3(-)) transporter
LWAVNALIFRKKITIPAATWFFIAFVIWCGLSLYWSISLSQGLTLFQTYLLRMVLFLFLGVNLIDTKKKLDYFMITLALNGVLIISAGLIQIVLNGYTPGQRFSVLSMNENGVGIQLLIAFIGVAWWGLQPSKRFQTVKRVLVLLFMTISMGFIAITGSRGSAISFVAMLFIFALFKPTRFLFVFGVVLVLLGFLFAPFLFQTTIERFLGATGETTLGGREGLWQAAQLLIKDHFLIGVGVGNSAIVIKDYLSNPAVSMNLMPVQVWTQDLISLHNPILTIISDTGVVGFILYFGMVVVAGLSLILKYMKDRNYFVYLYLAVIGSATVGYSLSWFKAGGIEIDFSTYLMVLILVLPVCIKEWNVIQEI